MGAITQERLRDLLDYNPGTGVFVWKVATSNRTVAGAVAGHLDYEGYRLISIDCERIKAHRLAFLYMDGYLPENQVDHIDRNRDNNARGNLREASQQCQSRNCGMLRNNTSGIKGVCWHSAGNKWRAVIRVNGRNCHLGIFADKLEATYHRYAAEQCLGFQDCDISSSALKFIEKA